MPMALDNLVLEKHIIHHFQGLASPSCEGVVRGPPNSLPLWVTFSLTSLSILLPFPRCPLCITLYSPTAILRCCWFSSSLTKAWTQLVAGGREGVVGTALSISEAVWIPKEAWLKQRWKKGSRMSFKTRQIWFQIPAPQPIPSADLSKSLDFSEVWFPYLWDKETHLQGWLILLNEKAYRKHLA